MLVSGPPAKGRKVKARVHMAVEGGPQIIRSLTPEHVFSVPDTPPQPREQIQIIFMSGDIKWAVLG